MTGEGTAEDDPSSLNSVIQKQSQFYDYRSELQRQIEEKNKKKEEEKRKLKDLELQDEMRVKRELKELHEREMSEKNQKKKNLGDIMDKY